MPRLTRKQFLERLHVHEELQAVERELTLSTLEAELHRQRRSTNGDKSPGVRRPSAGPPSEVDGYQSPM